MAASHVGSYAAPASFALGVALAGDTAFVADAQLGLLVIDVSNPAAPVLLRVLPTANTATDVEITDGRAYVSDGVSGVHTSFVLRRIIDKTALPLSG